MQMIVHERRDEADGVVSLTLVRTDGRPVPPWRPGAHVDLTLGDGLVRQYSLCSDPDDPSRYRIGVLREPLGRGGSRHVHDKIHDGDLVEVSEPRNNFELQDAPRYVFVAGGIGITPIVPMIRRADAAGADWTLLYGGRSRTSMAFLAELAEHGGRVTVAPQDEVGLPDLDGPLGAPSRGTLVYACGPGPMLDAVAARMRHWPVGSLHVERFAAGAADAEGPDETFEVEFRTSGVTAVVGAGTSILSAAEQAGLRPDWSCREGTCGSCETSLLEGAAEHRDSVLTDEEMREQTTLMICVSRAERGCPRLALDL